MVEEIIAARGDSMPADVVPMERWGTSQEVAHVVEFLISEKASFVTVRRLVTWRHFLTLLTDLHDLPSVLSLLDSNWFR